MLAVVALLPLVSAATSSTDLPKPAGRRANHTNNAHLWSLVEQATNPEAQPATPTMHLTKNRTHSRAMQQTPDTKEMVGTPSKHQPHTPKTHVAGETLPSPVQGSKASKEHGGARDHSTKRASPAIVPGAAAASRASASATPPPPPPPPTESRSSSGPLLGLAALAVVLLISWYSRRCAAEAAGASQLSAQDAAFLLSALVLNTLTAPMVKLTQNAVRHDHRWRSWRSLARTSRTRNPVDDPCPGWGAALLTAPTTGVQIRSLT